MNVEHVTPWLIALGVAVLLAAAAGYAIGSGAAIGESEADHTRTESFRSAHDLAEERTEKITAKRGFLNGLKRGRIAGERVGSREATKLGGGEAGIQFAQSEIAAAQSAAAAARAEIGARQANCGAVAKAPDWCPTADELAGYRAAVSEARQAKARKQARNEQAESDEAGSDDADE